MSERQGSWKERSGLHRFSPVPGPPRRRLSTSISVCRVNVESSAVAATRDPGRDTRRAPRTAYRVAKRPSDGERHGHVVETPVLGCAGRQMRDRSRHRPDAVTAKRCSHRSKLRLKLCCAPRDDRALRLVEHRQLEVDSHRSAVLQPLEHRPCDESQAAGARAARLTRCARSTSGHRAHAALRSTSRPRGPGRTKDQDGPPGPRTGPRPPPGSKPHPHRERDVEVIGVQRKRQTSRKRCRRARRTRRQAEPHIGVRSHTEPQSRKTPEAVEAIFERLYEDAIAAGRRDVELVPAAQRRGVAEREPFEERRVAGDAAERDVGDHGVGFAARIDSEPLPRCRR